MKSTRIFPLENEYLSIKGLKLPRGKAIKRLASLEGSKLVRTLNRYLCASLHSLNQK